MYNIILVDWKKIWSNYTVTRLTESGQLYDDW
jgi:hypothetical protein